ncbi:MAG: UvrD-helicase domain-containing protein, partial [Thermoanaerobaculaceae bacterium]|nr:UvrD-helicase domain-containing protein [Thermoanaerobaculaceae bacterium]
ANLLKKYPNSCSVSNFEAIEESEAAPLYKQTAEILISKAATGTDNELRDAVARRLAALNEKGDDLKNQIVKLLQNRDRAFNIKSADQNEYDEVIQHLLSNFTKKFFAFLKNNENNFRRLLDYFDEDTKNELQNIAVRKDNLSYWKTFADVVLTKDGMPRKQKFPVPFNQLPKDLKELLLAMPEEAASELAQIRKISERGENYFDEESLKDIQKIFEESVNIFNSLLSKKRKDFVDLEISALENLSWMNGLPPNALEKMQFKIDHILVDEAQDLSDIEYKIISKLIEGWQEGDGRTIFFVGDPKQSIYRFRKSNVALFTLLAEKGVVRKDEDDYKLKLLDLSVNFRSEPKIIDFVNHTFSEYFKEDNFTDDVSYSQFFHPKEQSSNSVLSINKIEENSNISLFVDEKVENLTKAFAKLVSSFADNLKDDETIGILYKQRSFFEKYHEALVNLGINVETIEEEKLEKSQAVKHILNFLKAVLFKEEDLYWLLLLGAPWLDLTAKEIYQIAEQKEEKWFDKILNSDIIDKQKREILRKATEDFYLQKGALNFIKHFEELSGFQSIKKIYDLKGVEESREFFKILSTLSHLPPRELVSKTETALSHIFSPPEPLIPKNKIQAMTIHKAKGLEFDYVFVVGLDKQQNVSRGKKADKEPIFIERLDFDEINREFSFLSAPNEKNEITYELLSALDDKRGKSEYKRLYYVALTRAKKRLFLFGKLNQGKKYPKDSILEVIAKSHSLDSNSFPEIEFQTETSTTTKSSILNPPEPPRFSAEKIPFAIKRASEEVGHSRETALFFRDSSEEIKLARTKGIVIHKIFENFAKGKTGQDANYVKKLLKELRVKFDNELIEAILKEAENAWKVEDFKKLREKGKLITELPLEMEENEEIVVGRIDLLILGNEEAFAIDYKTGDPVNDLEKWIESKSEEYRSQVSIYKKMVSFKENIKEDKIKTFILFTKIPLLKEV